MILMCATTSRAQDPMAKWKPSVGDKFFMHVEYSSLWGTHTLTQGSGIDTLLVESVDSNVDTEHRNALVLLVNSNHKEVIYFDSSQSPSVGPYPFVISGTPYRKSFDFALSRDTQFVADDSIRYSAVEVHEYDTSGGVTSSDDMIYSPGLRWIVSYDFFRGYPLSSGGLRWEYGGQTLMAAATRMNSGVKRVAADENKYAIPMRGGFISLPILDNIDELLLFDPLGRTVRSWQLPAESGPREITLNVADLPSGVYFLRISSPGADEVKKVAIVH